MAIIYNCATTLNGFLADEHDSLQWLFDVPGSAEAEADTDTFLAGVGGIVMGSTTFEWLQRELGLLDNPGAWPYADRPTWVFSSRNLPLPEGPDIRVLNSPVGRALSQLRAATPAGTDIWVMGGGDLAGQFHDVGALDGIILTLAPVFLPAGRPTLPRRIEAHRLSVPQVRRLGHFTELRFEVLPG